MGFSTGWYIVRLVAEEFRVRRSSGLAKQRFAYGLRRRFKEKKSKSWMPYRILCDGILGFCLSTPSVSCGNSKKGTNTQN